MAHETSESNESKSDPKSAGSSEKNAESNGRRRRIVLIVSAVVLIIVLAFGIPLVHHALTHESTDDAFVEGIVISISPRISGYVAEVTVDDNQWVKPGDVLVKLDPADFSARRDAAGAALEAARAAAAEASAQVKTAEAQAAASASLRDQAEAQLSLAKATLSQVKAQLVSKAAEHDRDAADLKRVKEMSETGTITDQDLDHAVAAERMSAAEETAAQKKIDTQQAVVRQAEAALSAAGDNLRQAAALVDARKAQEVRARADIDQADAQLKQTQLNLSYTNIVAPADGYVTKRTIEKGTFVQAGQALMAIVRPDVWVTANFKETQLNHMRPGQPVTITVDSFPDADITGHVDSIQHGTGSRFSLLPPENATGNFIKVVQRVPVKIIMDPNDLIRQHLLVPGLSVVPDVDVSAPGSSEASKDASGGGSRSTSEGAPSAGSKK